MENISPEISVIMPVYNGEIWLKKSIESVLNQEFNDFEFIIINDGSTDNSYEIVNYYASSDRRIKLFNNKNSGSGLSLNFGISVANGKYVCFIDQDDEYRSDYLLKMHQSITKYDCDISFCYAHFIDENSEKLYSVDYPFFEDFIYRSKSIQDKLVNTFYPQWTKIIKREFLTINHITFPGKHNKAHDVPFHILCLWYSDYVSFVPEELYFHRLHKNQISSAFNEVESSVQGYLNSFYDLQDHYYYYNLPKDFIIMASKLFSRFGNKRQKKEIEKIYDEHKITCNWYDFKKYKTIKRITGWFYKDKIKNNVRYKKVLGFKFGIKKINNDEDFIELPKIDINNCGRYSYTAGKLSCVNPQQTVIGNFCSIGYNVQLGHGIHPLHFLSTSPYFYHECIGKKGKISLKDNEFTKLDRIIVGSDVWIGDNVFVKNGITIGVGAIVGANAVVTKDIPPYAVVAGNPAKVIKYRFESDFIEQLLATKWWLWRDDILKQVDYKTPVSVCDFYRNTKNIKDLV